MDHSPKFLIDPSEALALADSAAITLPELLPRLVPAAQSLARPPISNFPVAAVGLGPSGRIFVGVNLEFPGLPLHHSVHAEQFLLCNLSLNAEANLASFAVSAAPCGHCRQFLQELRAASDVNILVTSHATPQFTSLSDFLPHQFGPHDLLSLRTPLLLEPHHNALTLLPSHAANDAALSNGHLHNHKLKNAALDAANKSHAPYTASPPASPSSTAKAIFTKALTWNPPPSIPASAPSRPRSSPSSPRAAATTTRLWTPFWWRRKTPPLSRSTRRGCCFTPFRPIATSAHSFATPNLRHPNSMTVTTLLL
ncbi:hypothetical protein ACSQ67_005080 [Phaseolus vulgaris]